MLPTRQGSLRLFRFAGINVFLYWSWFIVAMFEIAYRRESYGSVLWNALEYLALFVIVLLHEMGRHDKAVAESCPRTITLKDGAVVGDVVREPAGSREA